MQTVIAHIKQSLKLIKMEEAVFATDLNPQDLFRNIEEVKGDPNDIGFQAAVGKMYEAFIL